MFQRRDQLDAEAGELWLSSKKDEDPWPVVICDEEMLQILAKGKRPLNARQEDGNWRKDYCPGGDLADQRCFPTMRLGTMQLWVTSPSDKYSLMANQCYTNCVPAAGPPGSA